MIDTYRIPVLTLLCLLVAVFGTLYARVRTIRSLLWLLGWTAAALQLIFLQLSSHPYGVFPGLSEASIQVAALMFLGSLSPLKLRHHNVRYITLFAVPLIFFSFFAPLTPSPDMLLRILMLLSELAAVSVAVAWSLRENLLPPWFTTLFALSVGGFCLYAGIHNQYQIVLDAALAGNTFITALLILSAYRRWTAGVVFTTAGLLLWCLPSFLGPHPFWGPHSLPDLWLLRVFNIAKVVTAIGMIVLVLEDELATHDEAKRNERRAHIELEEYARLDFLPSAVQDISDSYEPVCRAIATYSRFAQAALLLRTPGGGFQLAAHAGLEPHAVTRLEALPFHLDEDGLRQLGIFPGLHFELARTIRTDLSLLLPEIGGAEELAHPHLLKMCNREGVLDGLLLLWSLKNPACEITAEDILPIELLLDRLTSARDHQILARQVARKEKLASLGQMAAGIAHELNNPLTVLMGYSEIMTAEADLQIQKYAGIMLAETRRMKQIVESLVRFWRPSSAQTEEIKIDLLLQNLCQTLSSGLSSQGIQLILDMQPGLPAILGSHEQIQQVLLQLIHHSAASFSHAPADAGSALYTDPSKQIRIEACCTPVGVHLLISNNGPAFSDPERVFDPFFSSSMEGGGAASGLGLSLCYVVVREHGGHITAWNREPRGAVISLELPSAASGAAKGFISQASVPSPYPSLGS